MSVGAGHGHESKGLEDNKGKLGLLHAQDHAEKEVSKATLDRKVGPMVSEFLVQMDSHHGHEADEPGMDKASGYISFANKPLLYGGEAYAET
jgi:hypothetical protein